MFPDDLPQCPLGPLAKPDPFPDIPGDGTVIEHVQIDVKQRQLFGRQAAAKLFGNPADVLADTFHCPVKHQQLDGDVFGFAIRHRLQVRQRLDHHCRTDGHPG